MKFGGIPLMLCSLFSREGYFRDRVNLAHVRYVRTYIATVWYGSIPSTWLAAIYIVVWCWCIVERVRLGA